MITALLWRELRTRLARDEIAEDRLLTFKLARLVSGVHPVGDFTGIASLYV